MFNVYSNFLIAFNDQNCAIGRHVFFLDARTTKTIIIMVKSSLGVKLKPSAISVMSIYEIYYINNGFIFTIESCMYTQINEIMHVAL